MLLYKNKASGKHFIFIEDSGKDEGLFVTPPANDNKVKIHSVGYDLFHDDLVEIDENDERIKDLLDINQVERYKDFTEEDRKRAANKLIKWAVETRYVNLELIKNEHGEEFANFIKIIRENTNELNIDDLE